MDDSKIPKLKRTVKAVVKKAARPDGPVDRGEFTMSIARQEISEAMGFEDDELEEKKWRKMVKELVQEALDDVGDDVSGSSLAESSTAPTRTQVRKTARPLHAGKPRSSESKAETVEQVDKEVVAEASESEMSSVYDVPPARAKKRASNGKRRSSAKSDEDDGPSKKGQAKNKRQKKDPNEGLSTEEAKVADLKRIVVACGVRKQWGKELADCHNLKEERRHLESLLVSLGMKGNPTMGKARALKSERELAAELNDVKEFEAARGLSGEARAERKKKKQAGAVVVEDESVESEEEYVPDKDTSALGAVLDFLGDDSD